MKKYDAVIAGYTCLDLTPEFKSTELLTGLSGLLKPGKLIEINNMDISLGGVVSNTGLAMKKFNKKVFLNGLIGDDILGQIALKLFNNYKVAEGIRITGKAGIAFGLVIAPPGVDRIFLESPGCSQLFDISHINFNAVSLSHIFHFGYPPLLEKIYQNSGRQLYDIFSRIQSMDVITSLDLSLPDPESESGKVHWPEIMKRVLPVTDIFVPGLEEALQMLMPRKYDEIQSGLNKDDMIDRIPLGTIRELGKQIIDSGVKILLLKAGHRGIYLFTGDISPINKKPGFHLSEKSWNFRELLCDAYRVDPSRVKHATGAGDTAAAAFLTAILNGEDSDLSLKYAAIAGRNNLYCQDIYHDLHDWHKMTEQISLEPNELIYL